MYFNAYIYDGLKIIPYMELRAAKLWYEIDAWGFLFIMWALSLYINKSVGGLIISTYAEYIGVSYVLDQYFGDPNGIDKGDAVILVIFVIVLYSRIKNKLCQS